MTETNKLYINITNHCDVCCPFSCMNSDSKTKSIYRTCNSTQEL